jgi:hypothetical protein
MEMPLPEHIRVLINPNARVNRRKQISKDTVETLLIHEADVYVTETLSELPDAVDKILRGPTDLLIVSGGDGTLHLLLTEMLRQCKDTRLFPPLMVLRGGTMNMVANNLGNSRSPLLELRILGKILLNGDVTGLPLQSLPVLSIESSVKPYPLYGLVFANGIAFRILKEYYNGEPSPARAFNVTASCIIGAFLSKEQERKYFPRLQAIVTVDGKVVGRKDLRISVASAAPKLLLWFTVFDDKQATDDGFFFLANFMKTKEIAKNFWSLCRGGYEGDGHINRVVREVKMEGAEGFTIDGEIYEATNKDVCVIRRGPALRYLDLSGFSLSLGQRLGIASPIE